MEQDPVFSAERFTLCSNSEPKQKANQSLMGDLMWPGWLYCLTMRQATQV